MIHFDLGSVLVGVALAVAGAAVWQGYVRWRTQRDLQQLLGEMMAASPSADFVQQDPGRVGIERVGPPDARLILVFSGGHPSRGSWCTMVAAALNRYAQEATDETQRKIREQMAQGLIDHAALPDAVVGIEMQVHGNSWS